MKQEENLSELLRIAQLLIFDFDGTLADTSPLHADAFARVLAPMGISVNYSSIAGLRTSDAVRKCLTGGGREFSDAEISALVDAKQAYVRRLISTDLQPLPGVDDFLRWAKARYRLAMVTAGSRGTISLALEKLGYTGWFDPLICADDVARAKPDPEGFLKTLAFTGVAANEALVFEDSEAGFAAATAAGLKFVDVQSDPWAKMKGLSG